MSAVATTETRYAHITLDTAGTPLIAGTSMKLVELITSQQAYGWSPEELAYQFPYLTLGKIYSALAYYWDHQAEVDDAIARDLDLVDLLRQSMPTPPYVERLRRLKQR
jgi:uncharacterized protein (DUF433 family)